MIESLLAWAASKVGDTALGKVIGKGLEKVFPRWFKDNTKEIVQTYERRIEDKNQEIERKNNEIRRIEKSHTKEQKRFRKEERRMVGSLKRRGVATEKLIEKYHKPLNAILISYVAQHESINGRIRSSHFMKDELTKYNSKYLGGTDVLIPPTHVPKTVKTQEELKAWFEKKILKGRYCKIKFLVLFDLKEGSFWETYLPYVQKNPMHHTIGEVLSVEDVFTGEQIDRLSISEIIESGDIAWLASSIVAESELDIILKNQKKIEKAIGNPSLRVLSDNAIKNKLADVLSKYIKNSDSVAKAIINEAKFWQEKIKE